MKPKTAQALQTMRAELERAKVHWPEYVPAQHGRTIVEELAKALAVDDYDAAEACLSRLGILSAKELEDVDLNLSQVVNECVAEIRRDR